MKPVRLSPKWSSIVTFMRADRVDVMRRMRNARKAGTNQIEDVLVSESSFDEYGS